MSTEEVRREVLELIAARTKAASSSEFRIDEGAKLADLGLSSLGTIAIVVELQRRVGLDFSRVAELSVPQSVGELISLANLCRERPQHNSEVH
jgi:acyl carrier protein